MKYSFQDSASFIRDIEIYEPYEGHMQAAVYAPEGASGKDLANFKEKMRQNGFQLSASMFDGKDVLLLEGDFKEPRELLNILAKDNSVRGNYVKPVPTDRDKNEIKNEFNGRLLAAAAAYGGADALNIFSAGAIRDNKSYMAKYLLYMVPSFGLALGASQTTQMHMGLALRDLEEMLDNNNITIPTDARQVFADQKAGNGFVERILEFNAFNATDINAGFQTAGSMIGLRQSENSLHTFADLAVIVGMGGSMFMQDKHKQVVPSENLGQEVDDYLAKKKQTQFNPGDAAAMAAEAIEGNEASSFSQKWAGGWALSNNVARLVSKFFRENPEKEAAKEAFDNTETGYDATKAKFDLEDDYETKKGLEKDFNDLKKNRDKAILNDKAATYETAGAGLYLLANGIYAVSPKEHLPEIDIDKIITVAANVVMNYPDDQQYTMSQRVATLVSELKQIELSVDDVANLLDDKVLSIKNSIWLDDMFKSASIDMSGAVADRIHNEVISSPDRKSLDDVTPTDLQREILERRFGEKPMRIDEMQPQSRVDTYPAAPVPEGRLQEREMAIS